MILIRGGCNVLKGPDGECQSIICHHSGVQSSIDDCEDWVTSWVRSSTRTSEPQDTCRSMCTYWFLAAGCDLQEKSQLTAAAPPHFYLLQLNSVSSSFSLFFLHGQVLQRLKMNALLSSHISPVVFGDKVWHRCSSSYCCGALLSTLIVSYCRRDPGLYLCWKPWCYND